MKTNSTQQEILLITGTSFSARQWCEKNETGNASNLSEQEKLQEACWNGLLREMLPEIFEQTEENKNLYLWKIKEASSFIELELGEFPESKDNYYSIDPYSFISEQLFN
jgi:hypothetical protein